MISVAKSSARIRAVPVIMSDPARQQPPSRLRMALERIDWRRDDPRWFWMLWRPLPGHEDLNDVEQADCRESFRLILERCDPNLQAGDPDRRCCMK